MNRLAGEKSAYLKHASSQKIDWYPWSEKAFDRAGQEDRPVFLSSGAVWCHWCHVMAQECFYDDDISELLNNNFINIKLDRDERPDIDRRYQMAVAAMGQGGGWPLSMFLTPDKVPFFGGTYFPPEDRQGRPGFKKILKAVIDLYKSKKDEINEYTGRLMNALKSSPDPAGDISKTLLNDAVKNIFSNFDQRNGGFGTSPKFPMSGAMDFLIDRYYFTGDETTGNAVKKTLDAMARGGFYDQVGGGFHRYSTDEAWRVPHFEKMADDNAWLLRNYLSAYSVLGDEFYREIASGIITFIRDVLSDPQGGFYTSQDADVIPDDEGGYFTWTDEELRSVLTEEEYTVISLHLIHEAGSMHHDTSKKVLFQAVNATAIAERTGRPLSEVLEILKAGKEKMLHARNGREAPFIDTTLYTSINGMLISVFLHGFRILKDIKLKDFAIKSLDRILEMRLINNELHHTENVRALLDDYAYLVEALLAAYEVTGNTAYIAQAEELMKTCLDKLWDSDEGGFFDTDDHLLGIHIKGVEDMPHPSANSVCIKLLLKLLSITGDNVYRQRAESALRSFSVKAGEIGIHAGYYFSALDAYYHHLTLTLHAGPESVLSRTALSLYVPHSNIIYGQDNGYVVPCIGDVCYNPIDNPEALKAFIIKRRYGGNEVYK
jgi:uncharacterized protein YyaL (SSP411 family)